MSSQYDAIIIGAGMSGLAAGIRLAMYDKKVLILEKHIIAGGLNSYYQRRNRELGGIRKFDVGLHAMTNFVPKKTRGAPLTKLLKQLRIPYEDFKLKEQTHSSIRFGEFTLSFSNHFELLLKEVNEKFPQEQEAFNVLVEKIKTFDELNLNQEYVSTREVLNLYLKDELLKEMLLCPLLIYGSAWEHDMDFAQFVIMFKSIYLEGFARPDGGVRTIIDCLMQKYKELGGEISFNNGVERILQRDDKSFELICKKGHYQTKKIFSSAGLPETLGLCPRVTKEDLPRVGKMSFTECILMLNSKEIPRNFGQTIVFYNEGDQYSYRCPESLYDATSAVICFPDNYFNDETTQEGQIRITFMANYHCWKDLKDEDYKREKNNVLLDAKRVVEKIVNSKLEICASDIFTPTTVERFTSHLGGTVYGSVDKTRNGKTMIENLYIIGTDQGFLGIVGAMLSGISMANLYGLMGDDHEI